VDIIALVAPERILALLQHAQRAQQLVSTPKTAVVPAVEIAQYAQGITTMAITALVALEPILEPP